MDPGRGQGKGAAFKIDPFGRADSCLLRRDKEALLRVHPEPIGLSLSAGSRPEFSGGLWSKGSPGFHAGGVEELTSELKFCILIIDPILFFLPFLDVFKREKTVLR